MLTIVKVKGRLRREAYWATRQRLTELRRLAAECSPGMEPYAIWRGLDPTDTAAAMATALEPFGRETGRGQ